MVVILHNCKPVFLGTFLLKKCPTHWAIAKNFRYISCNKKFGEYLCEILQILENMYILEVFMKKGLFPEFAEVLFGSDGQRWPELGGTLVEPWRVIHRDYFGGLKISVASVKRYCRGYAQYPRLVRKHYLGDNGPENLQRNIEALVCSSTSVIKIRSIQKEVHTWLQEAELPEEEKAQVEMLYVSRDADPTEIAAFLAGVMHCVIAVS